MVESRAKLTDDENVPEGGIKADILKYPHHGQVRLHTPFLEAIDPDYVFMNGASGVMEDGQNYLKRQKIPYVVGYTGLVRKRTDGSERVEDYQHEDEADREEKNTPY